MRTYIPSPTIKGNEERGIPFVTITTASNVCSTEAYNITFPSSENRYITALSLHLSDEEMDEFLEKLAAARAERLAQQEQAYETLHAKFGGAWSNEPVVPLELAQDDDNA